MLWMILGIAALLAGLVILILGSMWGILLFLVGLGFMALRYSTMMRGSGREPNQGTFNGLNGQGKQQSEAVQADQSVVGEQPANIWEQMEKSN